MTPTALARADGDAGFAGMVVDADRPGASVQEDPKENPAASRLEHAPPKRQWNAWAGYHLFSDSKLRQLYGGVPEVGAGLTWHLTARLRIAAGAAYRWATGTAEAGPLVADPEVSWSSVPLRASIQAQPASHGLQPFGRLGVISQWNRESFTYRLDTASTQRSVSQWGWGIDAGAGVQGSGAGLDWRLAAAYSWIPGDRLAAHPSAPRRIGDMQLGGVSLTFGLAYP
ncbi:MAG: hypothetical protein GF355_17325 [Candidatus Eisenbacteria bacterium]|nr:hypothetical protein [Candidatus Eisenbacteria bacterium]